MSSFLEDQLIASVQSSIGSLLYDNAVFLAERLVASSSSEVRITGIKLGITIFFQFPFPCYSFYHHAPRTLLSKESSMTLCHVAAHPCRETSTCSRYATITATSRTAPTIC